MSELNRSAEKMNPGAVTALVLIALGPPLLMAPFAQSLREKKERRPFVGALAITATACWAFAILLGFIGAQATSDWGTFAGMSMMLAFGSYVLAGLVFVTNFMQQQSSTQSKKEPIQVPETTRGK